MAEERGQKFRTRGVELITHIAESARALLVTHGKVAPEVAGEIARDHAHDLASALGGQLFYLPKDLAYARSKRDDEIVAAFDGRNYDTLARSYGLTEARVRQIIEQHRREQQAARQQALFPEKS